MGGHAPRLAAAEPVRFPGSNLQRLEKLELLGPDKKQILYDLIDTYIRDAKTKLTYAAAG